MAERIGATGARQVATGYALGIRQGESLRYEHLNWLWNGMSIRFSLVVYLAVLRRMAALFTNEQ